MPEELARIMLTKVCYCSDTVSLGSCDAFCFWFQNNVAEVQHLRHFLITDELITLLRFVLLLCFIPKCGVCLLAITRD